MFRCCPRRQNRPPALQRSAQPPASCWRRAGSHSLLQALTPGPQPLCGKWGVRRQSRPTGCTASWWVTAPLAASAVRRCMAAPGPATQRAPAPALARCLHACRTLLSSCCRPWGMPGHASWWTQGAPKRCPRPLTRPCRRSRRPLTRPAPVAAASDGGGMQCRRSRALCTAAARSDSVCAWGVRVCVSVCGACGSCYHG